MKGMRLASRVHVVKGTKRNMSRVGVGRGGAGRARAWGIRARQDRAGQTRNNGWLLSYDSSSTVL